MARWRDATRKAELLSERAVPSERAPSALEGGAVIYELLAPVSGAAGTGAGRADPPEKKRTRKDTTAAPEALRGLVAAGGRPTKGTLFSCLVFSPPPSLGARLCPTRVPLMCREFIVRSARCAFSETGKSVGFGEGERRRNNAHAPCAVLASVLASVPLAGWKSRNESALCLCAA